MIGSTVRPAILSCKLAPQFSAVPAPARGFGRVLSRQRRRGRSIFVPLYQKRSKVTTRVVERFRVSSVEGEGAWEEPDDGSVSGGEDEEQVEDDWGAESDWEEDKDAPLSANSYEDDLVKEVEQLLGPDEIAILQQNATPNLDKISTAKWSPLHTLGLSGQIHYMDTLLESGVDIDAINEDGLTALHLAVIGKKEAVITHLLRKGANPHVRDRDGATPLHYAAQVGALRTVKLLIKYKADVNAADSDGWTPLHVAIQSRNQYISKILLVNGADRTRRTKDGDTPLDLSLCYGKDFKSYELASLLKRLPAYGELG